MRAKDRHSDVTVRLRLSGSENVCDGAMIGPPVRRGNPSHRRMVDKARHGTSRKVRFRTGEHSPSQIPVCFGGVTDWCRYTSGNISIAMSGHNELYSPGNKGVSMGIPLRFLSGSSFKLKEAQDILGTQGIDVIPVRHKIEELQTTDTERLVRDKALKAFAHIGRPLIVEHTGLSLAHLNGFPGGLTQVFWDALKAQRFSELFGSTSNTAAVARSVVAYVDGQRCHLFEGEISGRIAPAPQGGGDFEWDCVFVPDGFDQTFAQLGQHKSQISMRRQAFDRLAEFLVRWSRQ